MRRTGLCGWCACDMQRTGLHSGHCDLWSPAISKSNRLQLTHLVVWAYLLELAWIALRFSSRVRYLAVRPMSVQYKIKNTSRSKPDRIIHITVRRFFGSLEKTHMCGQAC